MVEPTIEQRCPACKGRIESVVLASYPAIYKKTCTVCGKSWEKREKAEDRIFNPLTEGFKENP